jgi:hypothetical protein
MRVLLQLLDAEKACLNQGGTSLGFDAVLRCAEMRQCHMLPTCELCMHVCMWV